MSLLRKCQNAEQDTCFRIPTFLTTATITITFAAPTNKMLLIITVVLKVTWQGKRRQNFKIWRSKNWKKILCWANSPCHGYVFVDLTRSPQCFLWKMGSSWKSYIRNINVNLYYKHFQTTGLYSTSVDNNGQILKCPTNRCLVRITRNPQTYYFRK